MIRDASGAKENFKTSYNSNFTISLPCAVMIDWITLHYTIHYILCISIFSKVLEAE